MRHIVEYISDFSCAKCIQGVLKVTYYDLLLILLYSLSI